jgi:3-deoxy-D-manno-octulosonic-acid transferase
MKSSPLPRLFYTLLLWLSLPYIAMHLFLRSRKQPEYLEHVAERFGRYESCTGKGKPVIWLHTVSVGETRAVASLIKRLQETCPLHRLLLTHTTPTGRAESERLYGDEVIRAYLPYDYPFAARKFLENFRPAIGVLMETEIWPNLIHACHENHIPLLLLNARMSEKSARRYAHYPNLTRTALNELSGIAAQNRVDAERLEQLGAHDVAVMGNLKFDIQPPQGMLDLGGALRRRFGAERKIFLAASTREGEEELLLDMLATLDIPGLLTVIVPRHPQRFEAVAEMLRRRNLEFVRRSEEREVSPQVKIVLGDSMGEMFAYYAACDIAFIGGSLLPFGGQNLMEACGVGKPVLVGPHTHNFQDASQQAVEGGAALRVADAKDLGDKLRQLFAAPERLRTMGQAGMAFIKENRGATSQAMQHLGNFLDKEKG